MEVPETNTGAAYTHAAANYVRRHSLDASEADASVSRLEAGRSRRGSLSSHGGGHLPPRYPPRTFSWRLKPERWEERQPLIEHHGTFSPGVREFYVKQREILEAYRAIDAMGSGMAPSDEELEAAEELDRKEQIAIVISNVANLVLFIAKVYASVKSQSLAVIASTLDSLLDLLSGIILWITSYQMRKSNPYKYPIGQRRMQPVGITIFAAIMACLGLQVLLEGVKQLIEASPQPHMAYIQKVWLIVIMVSVIIVKLCLWLWCRTFDNDIILAYSLDHFFDVVTNLVGLVSALLADRYYWWIDPAGAIILAIYTIVNWGNTVLENAEGLVGASAPTDVMQRLTYLVFNHHHKIMAIDTVRAYTFGNLYFVEVDIQLPADMSVREAHDIAETLQVKLESLPEVERAFVHIDYEVRHRPEHRMALI